MLNLGGPPKFKASKMAADVFQDLIGDLRVSIRYVFFRRYLSLFLVDDLWFNGKRYDRLHLTSDVNIQWKPDQGTFKFSGSYGK